MATDVVMLDMREVCDFADYFVIMTAETPRHAQTLLEALAKALAEQGSPLHHREGSAAGGWSLLDFSDVIVHVFRAEERDYYDLEGAWPGAHETVRLQ